MTTERTEVIDATGARWIVDRTTPNPYGRRDNPERAFWAFRVDAVHPAHLPGIAGFYAPTLEAARERLGA